jgi:hypothetical protein
MVREIIYLLFVLDMISMLSSWPGSIKKGNRKSEILLRDAEVGLSPIFSLNRFLSDLVSVMYSARRHACIHFQGARVQIPEADP